jgi:hypothetical protein
LVQRTFPKYEVIPYEKRNTFYKKISMVRNILKSGGIEKIPLMNGFYASLPMIVGAREGLEKLTEIADVRFALS